MILCCQLWRTKPLVLVVGDPLIEYSAMQARQQGSLQLKLKVRPVEEWWDTRVQQQQGVAGPLSISVKLM